MLLDIVNLRQFYSSRLGKKVRRRLRRAVRDVWYASGGLTIVGAGYTTDLLPLPSDAAHINSRIIALMPPTQGAIYWPVDGANHSVLADDMRPPFMPSSVHRLLMAHLFEHSAAPEELLRLWWQLLVPGGRLLLIVPNRRGLWGRFGSTPFAGSTAYSFAHLRQQLNTAGFTLREVRSALFTPPSNHPFWLHAFGLMEWLGGLLVPRMGGVLILEAEKQIYAGVRATPSIVKARTQWSGVPAMNSTRAKQSATHQE
jgi:SAM-dependent methyltransferase